MDERYVNGYGTRCCPFRKREAFTYGDLMPVRRGPYQNLLPRPTLRDVDALDARRPVATDPDDD